MSTVTSSPLKQKRDDHEGNGHAVSEDAHAKRAKSSNGHSTSEALAAYVDPNPALTQRCIDTIRVLSADTVEKGKSGHPGAPMGCAPIAHVLFGEFMKYDPADCKWSNRDRFVLSNGHASALLYTMLHLTGHGVTMDDLKQFRQLGSCTPGHPENFATIGVEVTTGPLGQGLSNAVGLAMAEAHLAAQFNRDGFPVVDHYTFVICGDGCLQEGVTSEASSLAGHLGLGKLIVCYDDNLITIDGETELSFTEDVNARYEAYGWHVQTLADVNDLQGLRAAIAEAKSVTDRPSLIKIRTIIGQGSAKQGTEAVHGAPLGASDLAHVKTHYGFDPAQSFVVPDEVRTAYEQAVSRAKNAHGAWKDMFAAYAVAHPELANEYVRRFKGELPEGWEQCFPSYSDADKKLVATRSRSEECLNAIARVVPEFVGGSADLTGSNLTYLKCSGDFQKHTPAGRYFRFGVREHGMAAISNGLFAHGGVRPFCATFFTFIGYALGAVRLSAISRFGVIYVMTHDSIGLGEDGPTHQPVESLEICRATPNLLTFRPCDGNETAGAYKMALSRPHTPSVLALTRQGLPTLPNTAADKVALGAYVIHDSTMEVAALGAKPSIVLVATGSEVSLAYDVALALANDHVQARVVSMPCWELFDEQSADYQQSIFPAGVPVLSIEASNTQGWQKWSHAQFGITGFGVSAPGKDAFTHFGFTVPNLVTRAQEVIQFYANVPGGAPNLLHRPVFPVITADMAHKHTH